jgi:eukaryotic-like serine/threonine-protein kinase
VSSGGEPRTLAERYRLDEVIGRGGMSTVYRGTDLSLDRIVAVKVALDPLVEQSPIYLARFTREAQSTAALNNPRIVTVYDAGADGPTRFIVMELVPGRSLADILRDDGPLEPDRAASVAAQVADALSAAHAAGIIHRDIKPGNIMVTADGQAKVLDFGIARALDSHSLTQTATVLGTSAYMSPEQALGQPVDARSDIYSLGCVLYEMLTGEPPFVADVSAAVLHQHVRVEPKPARGRNRNIPPALDALVMQMLAKSPDDRPQTATEVRDRLEHVAGSPGSGPDALTTMAMAAAAPTAATVPIEPAPEPSPEPPPATRQAPPRTPQRPTSPPRSTANMPTPLSQRSRTGFWITVFIAAVVLLGGAVAVALSGGGAAASSSTPSSSAASTGTHTSSQTNTSQQTATHQTTTATTPPTTSSSATSTSSTTPTTSTSSSTPTTLSSPSTATSTPGSGGTPPGQGGVPPGQAKKGQ